MVAPGANPQRIDPLKIPSVCSLHCPDFEAVTNDVRQSNKLPYNDLSYFPTSVVAHFLEKWQIKVLKKNSKQAAI